MATVDDRATLLQAMEIVESAKAIVRPRVASEDGARLLEDVVTELADDFPPGVVWLVGGPGSGKTIAIAHLSALFADDSRLAFLDEPTPKELNDRATNTLVFASASSLASRRGLVLRLLPWGTEDFVEYLLAVHPNECKSVVNRLANAKCTSWTPQLARIVLDRFAQNVSLEHPSAALMAEITSCLPRSRDFSTAAEHCLAVLVGDSFIVDSTRCELARIGALPAVLKLLRHSAVLLPLAAQRFAFALANHELPRYLNRRLPREFIKLVGERCRGDRAAVNRLRALIAARHDKSVHPTSASLLSLCDPSWRPSSDAAQPSFLQDAQFSGINWPGVQLACADVRRADFDAANLAESNFEEAQAADTCFADANLAKSRLIGLHASRANFRHAKLVGAKLSLAELASAQLSNADFTGALLVKADLTSADLTGARFVGADLCSAKLAGAILVDADLTDARLDEANLRQADLRQTILRGACFERAVLPRVQLEDVVLPHARFRGARLEYAQLTGSIMPSGDFRGAQLSFAHLAEINWPGADLRCADLHGASFHMGSSRSGLVGSPFACEGSKTGFYTDEREEIYFKRPEEFRKANLRGADLRGANFENVDFYLVDLRDARLDLEQLAIARRTGAILEDGNIE